ncbi:hypothetical protein Q428_03570 [Fervidicella metallireducens AeB]|uniref:Uncharacterized protein n=1 Tax=Fervidicella metallireducens AeB TaxID=1403537 RepID=A0A017RX28_9CLOT|nr:hypothetical protein [Fervidicella metallireducens]EYE89242.1 hypothetical protein Q428_03570 [Fervidicella metallireducens AeB]
MTDKEKIILFENYLREKGYEEEKIKYNILVVKLLVQEVLYYFEENLENIDTYTFEEFTDMIRLIDDELGGRNGIAKILDCMLELTEFLKINKMIKGGKIAHYKRMFSNIDYYLDKYDMMTGRKDDTKEFLKRATDNKFSHNVIKLIEDVNVYEFKTMEYIDKILSDIPFSKKEYNDDINLLKRVLISLNLIDEKNGQIDVTKKGRTVSRLPVDEKYAAILFLLIFDTNWNKVIFDTFNMPENAFDYSEVIHLISTIFINKNDIIIDLNSIKDIKEDETLVEISRERFRLAKMEVTPYVDNIINICLIGMGILDVIPKMEGW